MGTEKTTDWSTVFHETPKWFADAKFGMFFHWGPYSVPAFKDEWYSRKMYDRENSSYAFHTRHFGKVSEFGYKDFYPMFRGESFDADEWAKLAVRSGVRYAGPVCEHADNFSMWDSAVNPVNSVNYGPHRDVVGECFAAFKKRGLKTLATFHHQWLWGWFMSNDCEADVYAPENEKFYGKALPLETNRYDPYRRPDREFCARWREKVCEVIRAYEPDVLYFDSRTYIIREEDRFEAARAYYERKKDGILTYKKEDFPAGVGAPDLECERFAQVQPFTWQTDDHLENSNTWCIIQEPGYRSAGEIIQLLCDVAAKNGNLLLNVGPCADGSIHPAAKRELYAVGDWLAQNGEAIYESRPWKTGEEKSADGTEFRFTQRGGFVYAIAMAEPESGVWELRSLGGGSGTVKSVAMPGCREELSFWQTEQALFVKAPAVKPCSYAFVLKVSLA